MNINEGLSESERLHLAMLIDWQLDNSVDVKWIKCLGRYYYMDLYYN